MGHVWRVVVLPIAVGLLTLLVLRLLLLPDGRGGARLITLDVHRAQLDGSVGATHGLVILSDLECAKCRTFASEVLPRIRSDYVDPGLLRLAFLYTAIKEKAAMTDQALVECLGEQRLFWSAYPHLFSIPVPGGASSDALDLIEQLDRSSLSSCMSARRPEAPIDIRHLLPRGGADLPTFVIGPINKSLVVEARGVIGGGAPVEVFIQTFTALGIAERP